MIRSDKHRWSFSSQVLVFTIFVTVCLMANLKYFNLRSHYMDFGLFISQINALVHQNPLDNSGHLQPIIYLFVAIQSLFGLAALPYIMVTIQSALLIFPAYAVQKHYGFLPTFVYLLYFPLWFLALNEFHLEFFLVAASVGFFIAWESRKFWHCLPFLLLMCLTKEIYILQAAFFGLFMVFAANNNTLSINKRRLAIKLGFVVFVSLCSVFWIYVFIKSNVLVSLETHTPRAIFGNGFRWLGTSPFEMIKTLFTQPFTVINVIASDHNNYKFLLFLLGPMMFLPVFGGYYLIPTIPILLILFLSTEPNHVGISHHYSGALIGPFFFALMHGYRKVILPLSTTSIKNLFILGLTLMVFSSHVLLSPSPISRFFWTSKIWQYEKSTYFDLERSQLVKKLLLKSLTDKNRDIYLTNSLNWSYLQEFKTVRIFDFTITQPVKNAYFVFDSGRPIYIGDRGCQWIYGECEDLILAQQYAHLKSQLIRKAELVASDDGVEIYKTH